mmetsp:Transcript_5846/g.18319  ORF Transcript_5846/g.18319 Transcript_5846/m.18319 type:complete len:415 (+) Transcript_5846:1539-2783(+)
MGCGASQNSKEPNTKLRPRALPSEMQRHVVDKKNGGAMPLTKVVRGGNWTSSGNCNALSECQHYQLINAPPSQDYDLSETLGKGTFATVVLAKDKNGGEPRALKTIDLSASPDVHRALGMITLEVKTLRRINSHPNICHIHDCYFCKNRFHMILDLCSGGMLFDRIQKRLHYTEEDARYAFAQMNEAVGHCHCHAVVHRDVKPENVMYVEPEGTPHGDKLKLCDFGLSTIFHGHDLRRKVGTPGYDAPEILTADAEHRYGPEVDMWSLGCVLYVMLSGFMPFYGNSMSEVRAKTCRAEFPTDDAEWKAMSDDAKALICGLLVVDPAKRFTAEDVAAAPWLCSDQRSHDVHISHFSTNYRRLSLLRKFQGAVLAVIATNRLRRLAHVAEPKATPGDDSTLESKSPRSTGLASPPG